MTDKPSKKDVDAWADPKKGENPMPPVDLTSAVYIDAMSNALVEVNGVRIYEREFRYKNLETEVGSSKFGVYSKRGSFWFPLSMDVHADRLAQKLRYMARAVWELLQFPLSLSDEQKYKFWVYVVSVMQRDIAYTRMAGPEARRQAHSLPPVVVCKDADISMSFSVLDIPITAEILRYESSIRQALSGSKRSIEETGEK
jgi:hypothetical protein